MAIKLVVNGYFRSGTSIVWQALKESNPDINIFYEPCHGELLKYIDYANANREENKLHGMFLWDEYLSDKELLEQIKLIHPNPGQTFPNSISDFEKYLDVYHRHKKPAILQSNRWHLYLQHISEYTDCAVVHIIRNPFKVFHSTKVKYMSETNSMVKMIARRILWPFINGKVFELDQMFEYLFWKYQRSITPVTGMLWLQKWRWSMLEKFVFVWTITNYEAIKQVQKTEGEVLVYEMMERDPEYSKQIFEKYTLKFDETLIRKNINANFMSKDEEYKFIKIAIKIGVEKEFDFIIKSLNII